MFLSCVSQKKAGTFISIPFFVVSQFVFPKQATALSPPAQSIVHEYPTAVMSRLIWHRRDLRLHDNELYTDASPIFSLFIFDPAEFSPRPTGIQHGVNGVTHGPHFTRHLLRAVEGLRSNLRKMDGELLIRHGNPLEIIPKLARELNVREVAYNEVPGYYEYQQSEELKISLRSINIHAHTTSSLTLAHPDDLPSLPCSWESMARPKEKNTKKGKSWKKSPQNKVNEVEDYLFDNMSKITDVSPSRFQGMPSIMGDFRRASRAAGPVRRLAKPSESLIAKDFCGIEAGEIPSLEDLILPLTSAPSGSILGLPSTLISHTVQSSIDRNSEMQQQSLSDYEAHAMQHLEDFVTKYAALADRSLADVSKNDSSKLSVNLALGVLSPRQIYHCVKSHQSKMEKTENQKGDTNNYIRDCTWLISHMEMRDYFLFDSFRNGPKSYHTKPHKPKHMDVRPEEWLPFPQGLGAFNRWASGQTNLPLVDAGINELLSTGYTSNRVRQNMASVLSKDLKLDWRLGAEWFQFCLSDHCVAANYGNWAYFSGVGGDPKNRHFRTISQAWRYDSEGKFVRKWNKKFDSLKLKDDYRHHSVRVEVALRPWDFYDDWGTPIVDPMTQLTWQDKERFTQFGMISR